MRQRIENPSYMTAEELESTYDGKWVFIVNAKHNPHFRFLGGVPVVVADNIFEGQSDGFYEEFMTAEYSPRTDMDYTEPAPELLNAFFGVLDGECV
jgi:hypothetical protein